MGLLPELKDKLRVTWDTEDTRLTNMLARGKAYFNNLTDTELDFDTDDDPKTLLFERCFYDYNNALGDFEENYGRELERLILRCAMQAEEKRGEG